MDDTDGYFLSREENKDPESLEKRPFTLEIINMLNFELRDGVSRVDVPGSG